MSDLDLTELRRQIETASPKHGPGRVVKLERKYAKAILAEIEMRRAADEMSRDLVAFAVSQEA